LTTIEAMACGTPTISLRRGAAPEIIKDGKTGFLVDSIAEMAAAIDKIDTIKRADCRDHVKAMFSLDQMVDAYEQAFEDVLRKHRKQQTPAQRGRSVVKKIKHVTLPKTIKKALPVHSKTSLQQLSNDFKEVVQKIANTESEKPTD